MSRSSELLTKLINSSAYRSIRAEQDVVACLRSHKWLASQSPFYRDSTTGKTREIDAVGIRSWEKKRKNDSISAQTNLYIEVKSAKDSHLLLSGSTKAPDQFKSNEYWIGYDEETIEAVSRMLDKVGFDNEMTRKFLHGLEKTAFPRDTMRTSELRVAPYPDVQCFSAFRETNIGADKDLDNSVLWRAFTALRSAVDSKKKQLIEHLISDLSLDIEVAQRDNDDPIDAGFFTIERRSSHIKFFHPIVVIDSMLWSVVDGQPIELPWFRFVQINSDGHVEWWCDVVNSSSFGKLSDSMTKYYERTFRHIRTKPAKHT